MLYLSDLYVLYILAFVGAIGTFLTGQWPVSAVLLIYSLAGLWYYLRYGTVDKALARLAKGNLEKACRIIRFTATEKHLDEKAKAYYHFIKGLCAYHNNDFAQAYGSMQKALSLGHLGEKERQLAWQIVEELEKSVM